MIYLLSCLPCYLIERRDFQRVKEGKEQERFAQREEETTQERDLQRRILKDFVFRSMFLPEESYGPFIKQSYRIAVINLDFLASCS